MYVTLMIWATGGSEGWVQRGKFTELSNIDFAPEVSILTESIPINIFTVDIKTSFDFEPYINCKLNLYGDNDVLYASYYISTVNKKGIDLYTVTAQSPIFLLDEKMLPAAMYSSTDASIVIGDIFTACNITSDMYYIESLVGNKNISGYMPEQTARERLRDVCFVIGGCVSTSFSQKIRILAVMAAYDPTDFSFDDSVLIPRERTFFRPQMQARDYIARITVRAYTYTSGTPSSTDEYIEVNGSYYIETTQDFSVNNEHFPDIPPFGQLIPGRPGYMKAPNKEIVIKNIRLINPSNVSRVLSYMASYYFSHMDINGDILDSEGEFRAGEKALMYTGFISDDTMEVAQGYIKEAVYKFGMQTRAKLAMWVTQTFNAYRLKLKAVWNEKIIDVKYYYFPEGYSYMIENLYIDKTMDKHRYIFRPARKYTSGQMTYGKTETVNYHVAIDSHDEIIRILSVDDFTVDSGIVRIV